LQSARKGEFGYITIIYSRRKKEEGRRKKEDAIKSMVSTIYHVLAANKELVFASIENDLNCSHFG
jgi:hypothetical protein